MLSCEPLEERRLLAAGDAATTIADLTMANASRQESDVAYFQPDRLLVEFTRGVNTGASGAHTALNKNNWRLLDDGADASNLIANVQALSSTELAVRFSAPLPAGDYRLIVRDLIHDDLGRPLDGDDQFGLGGNGDFTFHVASATSDPGVDAPGRAAEHLLPVTASDVSGNYVVAWVGTPAGAAPYQQSQTKVLAQRYDVTGERVGGLIVVDEPAVGERYSKLLVSMGDSGSFVVAWASSHSVSFVPADQNPGGFARRFNASGVATGNAFAIAPPRSEVESIAISADGDFLAVGYRQSYADSRPETLFIQYFNPDNSLRPDPVNVGPGSDLRLGDYHAYDFDNGPYNSVSAVWIDKSTANPRLMLQRFRKGVDEVGRRQISWLPGTPSAPAISFRDMSDELVVVWNQEFAGRNHVMALRFDSFYGYLSGAPDQVTETASPVPLRPTVARSLERRPLGEYGSTYIGGSYFVAWDVLSDPLYRQSNSAAVVDAQPGSVRARAYDPSGNPRGAEFAIGSIDASAGAASLVALSGETLAIAWLDGFQSVVEEIPAYVLNSLSSTANYKARSVHVRQFEMPTKFIVDLNGAALGKDFQGDVGGADWDYDVATFRNPRIHGATNHTVHSLTATIVNYLPGDKLEFSDHPSDLTSTFKDGVLTLTGETLAHSYRTALTNLRFSSTAERPHESIVEIRFVANDGVRNSETSVSRLRWRNLSEHVTALATHVFYNNSSYDQSQNGAANDAAIATDKVVLLPDELSSPKNITSYPSGINGLMIDIPSGHRTIQADDFVFRIGSGGNKPKYWSIAPEPNLISVRPGAGVNGSDRVELIWDDGVIRNSWLEVIMLANRDTGLSISHAFFIGNRVADTGNQTERAQPNTREALAIINRLRSAGGAVSVALADAHDLNRDGRVNTRDLLIVFNEIRQRNEALMPINVSYSNASLEKRPILNTGGTIGTYTSILTGQVVAPLAQAEAFFDANGSDKDKPPSPSLPTSIALLMEEPDEN